MLGRNFQKKKKIYSHGRLGKRKKEKREKITWNSRCCAVKMLESDKDKEAKGNCGGAKTWVFAVDLSTTFYQQCVRGEEIIGKPRN